MSGILLSYHKYGIRKDHLPALPEASEQRIVYQVNNIAFAFFLHAKDQAVIHFLVDMFTCKPLYRFGYTFYHTHIPSRFKIGKAKIARLECVV